MVGSLEVTRSRSQTLELSKKRIFNLVAFMPVRGAGAERDVVRRAG